MKVIGEMFWAAVSPERNHTPSESFCLPKCQSGFEQKKKLAAFTCEIMKKITAIFDHPVSDHAGTAHRY